MKTQRHPLAKPSVFCLTAALMLVAPVAFAQETKAAKPEISTSSLTKAMPSDAPAGIQTLPPIQPQGQEGMIAEDEELIFEPLQVGDATQGLLAWQSSGEIASAVPRPIAGAVANRSYERYLKSFEFAIPERMTSSIKSSIGGSSGR